MSIYAIADLHLSFSTQKPMDMFGGEWVNHTEKVQNYWIENIKEEDTVILPGDNSWALRFDDLLADLDWIAKLPGKKVLIKGNHDLWWNSPSKLNSLHENMFFLQNNFIVDSGVAICGGRGWICPGANDFTIQDEKIYKRELGRIRLSLTAAEKEGYGSKNVDSKGDIIFAMHFPPTNESLQKSGFTDLFEEFGVKKVVYGHLHGRDAYNNGLKGIRNGIEYYLTSTDYLKCMPLKIL